MKNLDINKLNLTKLNLKKDLNNPKISNIRKAYLIEKLSIIEQLINAND